MTYVQTSSGRPIVLRNPRAAQIEIRDIAHHLSQINRFNGATAMPIPVALHSVNVARLLALRKASPLLQLKGLLHDAHEYALGDIVSPVKRVITEIAGADIIKALADGIDRAIYSHLGLVLPTPAEQQTIDAADLSVATAEWRDHMQGPCPIEAIPAPFAIRSLPPQRAAEKFLDIFQGLNAFAASPWHSPTASDLIK